MSIKFYLTMFWFFFPHFKDVISLPSALTISVEKPAVLLYSAPLNVMRLVFPLPFLWLFFFVFFLAFNYTIPMHVFFILFFLGCCRGFWKYGLKSLPVLENSHQLMSAGIPSALFSFFYFFFLFNLWSALCTLSHKILKMILQGAFVIIPALQMIKLRFERVRDQPMINNQEVSESEHKTKFSPKNSVDDLGNKPKFKRQWSPEWILYMDYLENFSSPPYYHHIEWCSWKNV